MGRGALNGGAWTDSDAQRSGGFNVFWFSSFYSFKFPFENKTLNSWELSTVNRFEASPESSRLGTDCIVSKLTRRSNARALFRMRSEIMRLLCHCRA